MEAVGMTMAGVNRERLRAELRRIRDTKGKDGKGLAGVESATGISRSAISQFVNRDYLPDERKLAMLAAYLETEYGAELGEAEMEDVPAAGPLYERRFGLGGKLYHTRDFGFAFGRLDDLRRYCVMCVMFGCPGTGKTTILREYARRRENTYYVDCWPYTGTRDLLESIAMAMGFGLKAGSVMNCTRQLLAELNSRPGAMLIYDEAENLRGENAKKLDTLRKLCDETPTSALLAGTMVLRDALTRGGNGPLNMAQITRRNHAIYLKGVRPEEVREMLREYDVSEGARQGLIEIATDVQHGGLGNFVELLNICLNIAQGGEITERVLKNAKAYKLLY